VRSTCEGRRKVRCRQASVGSDLQRLGGVLPVEELADQPAHGSALPPGDAGRRLDQRAIRQRRLKLEESREQVRAAGGQRQAHGGREVACLLAQHAHRAACVRRKQHEAAAASCWPRPRALTSAIGVAEGVVERKPTFSAPDTEQATRRRHAPTVTVYREACVRPS
jgi:hypothetical protein